MNVLVVHDREEVGRQICEVVESVDGQAQVHLVNDAMTARSRMTTTYYDLLILDLTIPNVAGRSEPSYQAAENLLEEIFSPGQILTPGSLLGITREADALERIETNIGAHLMSIIDEDAGGRWRQHLNDRVSYLQRSQKARNFAWLTKFDFDLLILTALDKELRPFRSLFELSDAPHLRGVYEFSFTDRNGVPRRGACSAIGRAGQASAASEAQGLICQLRPKLAMMTGFCGGLPKAKLGDVLFADSAIDWDYGKWRPAGSTEPAGSTDKLHPRPEPISIRNSQAHRVARILVDRGAGKIDTLSQSMMALSKGEIQSPGLDLVPFASGSAVVGATNVLDGISALNDSIGAVDMEAYGFYYACRHSKSVKPEFICIKAVADDCGPSKDGRLHEACSYGAALVARQIVAVEWDFEA